MMSYEDNVPENEVAEGSEVMTDVDDSSDEELPEDVLEDENGGETPPEAETNTNE